MPSRAEVLRDGTIGGEEALGMPRGFDPLHAPFPLARRLVRVLGAIVQIAMLPMFDTRQYLALRGAEALELIGYDDTWHVLAPFEELAQELLCGLLVPPPLHQDIEHDAVLIHSAPQIMALTVEREKHFIQMPLLSKPRPPAP
jgi:hypothetical protein